MSRPTDLTAGRLEPSRNREMWLGWLLERLRPLFISHGARIPDKVRVACGWPKGRREIIGQCWPPQASSGSITEIFISPRIEEPLDAAAVLVHEAVHAVVGVRAGHRAPFRRLALAVGLEGRMTATVAGEVLKGRLNGLIQRIGPYPHYSLTSAPTLAPSHAPKKQAARLLKAQCHSCGYTIRVTQMWLKAGYPTCPCGSTIYPSQEA